jgi:CBS domain-containing protein
MALLVRAKPPSTKQEAGRPASRRARRRSARILATKAVRDAIVSLAGLLGAPVRNPAGAEIGRLHDVVVGLAGGQTYPPVTGLVVKVGRRLAFVDASVIDELAPQGVRLRHARIDLQDFARREQEVLLARDVLDHQLVDVDGVQVVRASDLYLAQVLGRFRLVGVDVSLQSLLRRLGPRRLRARPTPDRVIDWAAIELLADRHPHAPVRLRTSHEGLHRLRPSELADLLEDLERPGREELLAALDPEEAADALEEMDAEEVRSLFRELSPKRAAELLEHMEPDEAVDALRDLDAQAREALLACMQPDTASRLEALLAYPERTAGGIMTTAVVRCRTSDTVAEATEALRAEDEHRHDLDGVAVVDAGGELLADLPIVDLLLASDDAPLGSLLEGAEPVVVRPEASLDEVARRLAEARRLSLVVVDEQSRPIGRILADDVLDALLPERGVSRFPRLLAR